MNNERPTRNLPPTTEPPNPTVPRFPGVMFVRACDLQLGMMMLTPGTKFADTWNLDTVVSLDLVGDDVEVNGGFLTSLGNTVMVLAD